MIRKLNNPCTTLDHDHIGANFKYAVAVKTKGIVARLRATIHFKSLWATKVIQFL